MKLFTPFAIGLTFGMGLVISGMSNPAVVLGFLDVTGHWNPALALVMGGALAVSFPAYAWVRRHQRTWTGAALSLPTQTRVTPDLVVGASVFGVGWGWSGFCPGPAIVAVVTLHPVILIFVASMAVGYAAQRLIPPLSRQVSAS